jgi:hypothetical protein
LDGEGDEALLGAVMEVALESTSLGKTCFDDPSTGRSKLVVCLSAFEGE